MKNDRIQGLALIFVGLILIALYGIRSYSTRSLSFNAYEIPPKLTETVPEKIYTKPVSIKISSLNINLPVEESQIIDGVWQVSEKNVSHLNSSANPGEGGNVVIYGHNKKVIFGPIRQIKKDAEVIVATEDEKLWKYKVAATFEVTPDEVSPVLPKNEETLTLYTCTGFADSRRFIIVANPEW